MGELKNGPLNCLLCLKSTETHNPLKWEDDDFIDGIPKTWFSSVNSQLGVIFILKKLLKIPSDICVDLLQSYGDPCFWIACCDSCSEFVEKGRQICIEMEFLQKKLEEVQDDLKASVLNSGELILNYDDASQSGILRCYIRNELKEENTHEDTSMENQQKQLQNSLFDCLPLSEDNLDTIPVEQDIMDDKIESGMLAEIKNDADSDNKNISRGQEYDPHVGAITGDLDIPSEDSDGVDPSNKVKSIQRFKKSKRSPTTRGDGGKKYQSRKDLRSRQMTHTGKIPFACEICGKTFATSWKLKRHTVTHTGEKAFECDICGKFFSLPHSLTTHTRTHTGERPFECDICESRFSRADILRQHIMATHTLEKPFACDICGKKFILPGGLKRHIRTHTGEKAFKCDICGKGFSLSGNLKAHIRTHTGERPF